MTMFYCFNFWDSSNLDGQLPTCIFLRNKVAQLYRQAFPRQYINIHFVPHREYNTSPLQSPTGRSCLRKQSLFIENRTEHTNTLWEQCVIKLVVHIVTTVFRNVKFSTLLTILGILIHVTDVKSSKLCELSYFFKKISLDVLRIY
jgi:hypothetical protein